MATEVETEPQIASTEDQKLYEFGLFEIRRDFLHRENEFRYSHKRHAVERESNISHYYQSSLRETSDSLIREPIYLRNQISQLKEELSIERANNQYLRFQLVDAGKEISDLEIDVRRARAGLPLKDELAMTPEETEKNLAQLKRKVDRMRASMLEMDAQIQKLTKDREELRDKNSDLAKVLDNAQQAQLKAENAAKDVERRSTRRVEELETKLKAKIDECVNQQRELENLRGLPEQMEAQSEEMKAVQRGADHVRAEFAEYRTKYDALTDKLQSELRAERSKSLDLEAKIRSLTSQLEREKTKVADEQKQRKDANDKVQKSKAEMEKLHKKCDELTLEVAHLEKTIRIYERNK